MSCRPETHVIPVLPGQRIEVIVALSGIRYCPQYLVPGSEDTWQDYLPDSLLGIRDSVQSLREARNVIARAVGREEV